MFLSRLGPKEPKNTPPALRSEVMARRSGAFGRETDRKLTRTREANLDRQFSINFPAHFPHIPPGPLRVSRHTILHRAQPADEFIMQFRTDPGCRGTSGFAATLPSQASRHS